MSGPPADSIEPHDIDTDAGQDSPAQRAAFCAKGDICFPPFDEGGEEGFRTQSRAGYECYMV